MLKFILTTSIIKTILVLTIGFASSIGFAIGVANEPVSKPKDVEQGLGNINFPISCHKSTFSSFEKAIALLHSFEYDAARLGFKKITQAQPGCAMAYWGVAMTYLQPLWAPPSDTQFQQASIALNKAARIPLVSSIEADYINALGQYFIGELPAKTSLAPLAPATCHGSPIGGTSHREKLVAYQHALAEMYIKYPKNIEVALFYALALVALADPDDDTYQNQYLAGEIMQDFIASNPNHPGLAHYIIHCFDTPDLAKNALEAAHRYAEIAPDSAHALHMPSHIFQRLGMWQDSIKSNIASTQSARNYAKKVKLEAHWDEELHGLDFLTNAYMQTGELVKAKEVRDYIYSMEQFYPENFKVAYVLSATPARFVLEQKDWLAGTKLPLAYPDFPWDKFPWERAITHFAIGFSHARIGNIQAAEKQIAILNSLKKTFIRRE